MADDPPVSDEIARIPTDGLVVLVGPSGSGKSTWADEWFRDDQIVSSDRLRALVGTGPRDVRAGTDAFAVLDDVVARRLRRGLLTVIDSLGLDDERRATWTDAARTLGRPTTAVWFDTPDKVCRARNRSRPDPVPAKVVTAQIRRRPEVRGKLDEEFDVVVTPRTPVVVPKGLRRPAPTRPAPGATTRPRTPETDEAAPPRLRFGLHLSSFTWPGDAAEIAPRLGRIARLAETSGFDSLWVMDHMLQIPQVGREWEPMLEGHSTLAYLAAVTDRVRLGTLVTGITYRNVAHVAKLVATLDVLSSGRAECGLGAAWYEREHRLHGYRFPPIAERYELLEDALELLPLMWGPGSPAYEGRRIGSVVATCYPRPVQDRVPILVGGSGPARTLKLVARHADACNLFGEPDRVRELITVLHGHCERIDRDPEEIQITQLSSLLAAPDPAALRERVEELRGTATPEQFIDATNAGLADDHGERFEALAAAGVGEVIVRLHDVERDGAIESFGALIDRLR